MRSYLPPRKYAQPASCFEMISIAAEGMITAAGNKSSSLTFLTIIVFLQAANVTPFFVSSVTFWLAFEFLLLVSRPIAWTKSEGKPGGTINIRSLENQLASADATP